MHFGIDEARGLFAERLRARKARGAAEIGILSGRELHHSDLVAHAPAGDHVARELGRLLDIVLGAGRARAVHHFFRRTPAEHSCDARAQIGLGVVIAIGLGSLIRDAQRHPARHDGHPVDRVRARNHESQYGVAAFMIRDAPAVLVAQEDGPLGAEHDFLQGIHEVLLMHRLLIASRGEQSRFVHEILQVGAGEAGRDRCDLGGIDVRRERHLPRVHLEDRFASAPVRQVNDDPPVEASRPQQRLVENVRLIRRGQHDDAFTARKAVHLRQNLLERLFVFAGAADRELPSRASDRVDFVDEDDRGRALARLAEEVTHWQLPRPRSSRRTRQRSSRRRVRPLRLRRLARAGSCRYRVRRQAARPSVQCRRDACISPGT